MTRASDRILAALPRLRAEAESLMTATWLVERLAGDAPLVGYAPTPTRSTVYSGRGKLQSYEGHEQRTGLSSATVVVQRLSIHFPVGSFDPQPGDVATCTASTDPAIVGRVYRIAQAWPVKEHATSYRVFVDEVLP